MSRIPMSLPGVGRTDTLSPGAKKALGHMRAEYGAREGNRIFIEKAKENGKGQTLRAKVNSTYRKGAKLSGNQI